MQLDATQLLAPEEDDADDPLLELVEPATQDPAAHVPLLTVQSVHVVPLVPHAVSAPAVWHVPVLSQQPAVHVLLLQLLAELLEPPASSPLSSPLLDVYPPELPVPEDPDEPDDDVELLLPLDDKLPDELRKPLPRSAGSGGPAAHAANTKAPAKGKRFATDLGIRWDIRVSVRVHRGETMQHGAERPGL